jgi:hypothetical protein
LQVPPGPADLTFHQFWRLAAQVIAGPAAAQFPGNTAADRAGEQLGLAHRFVRCVEETAVLDEAAAWVRHR